jgi:hypothetical protein
VIEMDDKVFSPDQAIMTRLKHALQALAMSYKVQLSLFPDHVAIPDELALDFAHWYEVAISSHSDNMTREQQAAFKRLDGLLQAMSRGGELYSPELWTEQDLQVSDEWARVRLMAQEALEACGWAIEAPQAYKHEYVIEGIKETK